MGLLDQPLVSEMDEIEAKAKRGDEAALRMIYDTLSPMKRVYIDRLMRNEKKTMRQAFERAGILICLR